MNVAVDSPVRDAPPPAVALHVVNPVMRCILRTPLARRIKPLALLSFEGRHTGRRRRVVVGWHIVDGSAIVVTPAAWRVNFMQPRIATIRWRGRQSKWIGLLETDPSIVADVVGQMLRSGTSDWALALHVPTGHAILPADVIATRRAIIRFTPSITP